MAMQIPPRLAMAVPSSNASTKNIPVLNNVVRLNVKHPCLRPIRIGTAWYPESSSCPRVFLVAKAVEEDKESSKPEASEVESAEQSDQREAGQVTESKVEFSELGSEIKKVLQERKEKEERGGGDLLSGVAEEIREIEWPAFGKVLGTTGVVLSVIAGSSIVLLTVNAVLAELSDKVFAGKGVQDFFG